jgi:hypothetical protein
MMDEPLSLTRPAHDATADVRPSIIITHFCIGNATMSTQDTAGLALQSHATRFLSRFQDEGTWFDREAMELQKAVDKFFADYRAERAALKTA